MGGTSLKRKARRNKTRVKSRKARIKLQGFKPVIRSIDKEAAKLEFANSKAKPTTKAEDIKVEKIQSVEKTAKVVKAAPEKEVKSKATGEAVAKPSTKKTPAKTAKKAAPKAKKESTPKAKTEKEKKK